MQATPPLKSNEKLCWYSLNPLLIIFFHVFIYFCFFTIWKIHEKNWSNWLEYTWSTKTGSCFINYLIVSCEPGNSQWIANTLHLNNKFEIYWWYMYLFLMNPFTSINFDLLLVKIYLFIYLWIFVAKHHSYLSDST